jgi:putative ABC transport system permease protein
LLGIPGDTHFYALTDLKERPAPIPEDGILLSKNLADALDAQPGDRILLRHFLPGRADIPLEVKGIVSQYLGINGYMNIRAMQRQLLDQAMITGVSVHSRDAVVAKLKDVKGISAVNSIADLKQALLDYMDVMNASVYIFLVFGGLIGFAVIYNSVTINLSERQMELSSLRVLGFQKQDLFSVITRENALMTLCAIGAGIPLGAAMCYIVTDAMTLDAFSMPMRFFPFSYVEAAAATLIFSALAQLAVRRKLYALDFIEALKNRSI